jgi:hypothetical protein
VHNLDLKNYQDGNVSEREGAIGEWNVEMHAAGGNAGEWVIIMLSIAFLHSHSLLSLSEPEGGGHYPIGSDQSEQKIQDKRYCRQAALKRRDDPYHAAVVSPGHQGAGSHSKDCAAEQRCVQNIAHVTVFFLKNAEGAMMRGKLIDIKTDE